MSTVTYKIISFWMPIEQPNGEMLSYGGVVLEETRIITELVNNLYEINARNLNFEILVLGKKLSVDNIISRLYVSNEFGQWERGIIRDLLGGGMGNQAFYNDLYDAVSNYNFDEEEDYDDDEDIEDDDEEDDEPSF